MQNLENIIIIMSVLGAGVLVIYIIARYNYLLKKTLAERGMVPEKSKIRYAEMGCIVVGIGIGLGVSSLFTMMNLPADTMDLLVWSVILMGGGLGLFVAHFIGQQIEKGE